MSDLRTFVGVDVGGTKILATVVTGDGGVRARYKQSTDRGSDCLAPQVIAAVDGALASAGIEIGGVSGIGIAVPGVVDTESNTVIHTPNITVADPDVARCVAEHYGIRVALGNDVTLGTFAECWLGAGRDADTVVGIFVGTGIGGGVIIDGRIRSGPEDLAGEIGHMVLMVDGPVCGCGNRGCFEALASRTALESEIRRQLDEGRESRILELVGNGRIRSGPLATALETEDALITEVMTTEAHYLAQGILSVRHLLNPDMVILGGGVMEACGGFLLPLIEQEVRADCLRASRNAMRIVLSELEDDAVALGAVALVRAEIDGGRLGRAGDDSETQHDDGPPMPVIEQVKFGVVMVDGQAVAHDFYIRTDGELRKRKKKRARRLYKTSHVLDDVDMRKLCKGDPETVIIGCGYQSQVTLTDEAKSYLDGLGVDWRCLPTPDAAVAYNEAAQPKAVLLHVTC